MREYDVVGEWVIRSQSCGKLEHASIARLEWHSLGVGVSDLLCWGSCSGPVK
jgi:hypothetical protein